MSIWSRLFEKDSSDVAPQIRFGRYSDSYKNASNYTAWDLSLQAFEKGAYLECYKQFFQYLFDPAENNVFWSEENNVLNATIIQGSQKVTITATDTNFHAITHIAKADALNVGLMRRLLEQNGTLSYGHYALSPNNELTAVFTTHAIDGSPYKLYYALKEISTISDKQDNLLLEEFRNLQIIDITLRRPMPTAEQEAKYNFTISTINERLALLDNPAINFEQHSRAAGYILFDTLFRIEYLTSPEGYIMEIIERAFRKFSEADGKNLVQKNLQLRKEVNEIRTRSKEDHIKELYRVTSTFGITTVVNHEQVISTINEHLSNADWYQKNDYPLIEQCIYDYIVGFLCFNYALPLPDRDALHLYYEVVAAAYFKSLGIKNKFVAQDGKVSKSDIEKRLTHIYDTHKEKYPNAKWDIAILVYDNVAAFSKSYLTMLLKVDMTRTN